MLAGKVALITGSSRGIGQEVALRMAEHGAHVIVTYHASYEKAFKVRQMVESFGHEASLLQLDVCDDKSVQKVFREINTSYGRLDILVNNAGGGKPVAFEELSLEDWNNSLNLNLTGVFLCTKYAIPLLKKSSEGRIINMSSVAGLTGGAFGPHYASTKAGIIGLTKSAARELGRFGISVNAVAPGPIESEMTDSLEKDVIRNIINATPQNRLGKMSEVAEIVCQLANPSVGYINGQTIVVDGGRYMI